MNVAEAPRRRPLRSFVRREGRMTVSQKAALAQWWPRFGIDPPAGALDLPALFGRSAPVTMEIGFGNGDHLFERSNAEPERDFFGVEVHRPGVGRLLRRAADAELANLRISTVDAVEVMRDWIAAQALDEVQVLFPDPWPKKRHHKRRLVQPAFMSLVAGRLRCGGHLRLATDWAPYAGQMLKVLEGLPEFENQAADGRFATRPPDRTATRFESRGTGLGHSVFDLHFVRR